MLYSFSYNVSVVHTHRVWDRVDSEMVEEWEYAGWKVDSRWPHPYHSTST
jgi:hypothetical protein